MVASQHRRVPQERILSEVLEKAVDQLKDRHGVQGFLKMRTSFLGRLLGTRNAFVNSAALDALEFELKKQCVDPVLGCNYHYFQAQIFCST